jgi:hypothetical protein
MKAKSTKKRLSKNHIQYFTVKYNSDGYFSNTALKEKSSGYIVMYFDHNDTAKSLLQVGRRQLPFAIVRRK